MFCYKYFPSTGTLIQINVKTAHASFYPPPKAEGYRFVCPDVRPSVTNLLGLYLKVYYRFEHETSGVFRSHWGEVHCTRTITPTALFLELLLFVIFHIWILLGLYLNDYYRFGYEISGVYKSHWGEVHCTRTITLHCLILKLLPFVIFHTWILLGLYLKDYYRFEHETSGVYRSHWGEVHCTRTITLYCLILELLPFVIIHTWILCVTYLSDYKRYQHETLYVDRL